jgi:hypothetical protein
MSTSVYIALIAPLSGCLFEWPSNVLLSFLRMIGPCIVAIRTGHHWNWAVVPLTTTQLTSLDGNKKANVLID